MNRSEVIQGIAVLILGGAITLASLISGIFHFSEKLYKDFHVFHIELQSSRTPFKTGFFTIKEGQLFSVWLRHANSPQNENTSLRIAVSLIDEDGNLAGEFSKDFRFGAFRNSARKIRYLKLGEHPFRKSFRGYMQYELEGSWTPSKTSALVLRQSPPLQLPLKQIGFFLAGILVLFVGIGKMAKNLKNQRTATQI